ncbi:CoA ester lyase, partial [Burkholderia cenocepacia]|nr:CoA ester lyase [Burkholderia cenocepacia]
MRLCRAALGPPGSGPGRPAAGPAERSDPRTFCRPTPAAHRPRTCPNPIFSTLTRFPDVEEMAVLTPAQVLYDGASPPAILPCCDHYAGSEKLMRKSLALQAELGPVFDLTLDCEDGAAVGQEAAHAALVADLLGSAENRFGRVGVRIHDFSHP